MSRRAPLLPPGLVGRLRADRGIVLVVVLVVAMTTATAVGVSRSLDRLTGTSVREAVASEEVAVTGVTASTLVDRLLGDEDATAVLRGQGLEIGADLPTPLDQVVGDPVTVVDSIRFSLQALPDEEPLALTTLLTFRSQDAGPGLDVRRGRVPTRTDDRVEVPGVPGGGAAPVHEIALSQVTLDRAGLEIGDRLLAVPDLTDTLARRAGLVRTTPIVVEVVGELLLSDPSAPVWWGDPRLHRPAQIDTGFTTTYFAFGWVPTGTPGLLPGDGDLPAQVDWRFPVTAEAVATTGADATLTAARALSAAGSGLSPDFTRVVATTRLDRVLADEAARRVGAFNVLGLGIVAIGGVGTAVLLLLALLLGELRRDRTALTLGRGASWGQLATTTVVEAALLSVVGVAVGALVAVLTVAGPVGRRQLELAGVLVVAATAAIAAGGLAGRRRPLRELLQQEVRPGRRSLRSWAVEGAVVLVAVAGAVALRRRGLDTEEPDALVVAVPLLLAVAGGLVVRRLYRLPLRAGAVAARRRRGLGLALGLSRGARRDAAGPMVVVVVVAVAAALLAGAVASTIQRGQEVASWEIVGAPVRMDAGLALDLDAPAAALGTGVPANVSVQAMNSSEQAFGRADLLAADLQGLEDLLRGSATPLDLPRRALADVPVTPDGPTPILPAVASVSWFNREVLRLNDQVDVLIGTETLTYQVVAFRRRLLGLDEDVDGPFLVVPRTPTEALLGRDLVTNRLYLPSTDIAAVRAAAPAGAEIVTRLEVRDRLAGRALPQGVVRGFLAVALAAILFAVLAVATWQVMTARRRVHDLAVLSAVGTPRRTRFVASLAESLPAVLLGVLAGSVVGGITGDLLDGVVALTSFTGTASVDDIVANGTVSRWGTAAIAVAVTILVAGVTWRGHRADATRLLRED